MFSYHVNARKYRVRFILKHWLWPPFMQRKGFLSFRKQWRKQMYPIIVWVDNEMYRVVLSSHLFLIPCYPNLSMNTLFHEALINIRHLAFHFFPPKGWWMFFVLGSPYAKSHKTWLRPTFAVLFHRLLIVWHMIPCSLSLSLWFGHA